MAWQHQCYLTTYNTKAIDNMVWVLTWVSRSFVSSDIPFRNGKRENQNTCPFKVQGGTQKVGCCMIKELYAFILNDDLFNLQLGELKYLYVDTKSLFEHTGKRQVEGAVGSLSTIDRVLFPQLTTVAVPLNKLSFWVHTRRRQEFSNFVGIGCWMADVGP